LLAKGRDGWTAWNMAALKGNKEILVKLWGWVREVQVNRLGTLYGPEIIR